MSPPSLSRQSEIFTQGRTRVKWQFQNSTTHTYDGTELKNNLTPIYYGISQLQAVCGLCNLQRVTKTDSGRWTENGKKNPSDRK